MSLTGVGVNPMHRRKYKDGVELSIIGFGGMVLVGMEQSRVNRLVAGSIERGVNYFDIAPFYGSGEAEKKLGSSLSTRRQKIFLACKTLERRADGARRELERSLRALRTDYLDLYQFHAVTDESEVDTIFGAGGAAEAFLEARRLGKVRFLGFSAHSVEAALTMLDRFKFDSMLFPVNYVCCAKGNFGPQVLRRARELGVACLALKALASGPWRKGEVRTYPNCWYRPIESRDLARQALSFALSEDVTAAIPPGDERLFKMSLELADDLPPMTKGDRVRLLESAARLRPLFRYREKTPSSGPLR